MFLSCFECSNFRFNGYFCWCEKDKFQKIGIFTVEPIFFVRNCSCLPEHIKKKRFDTCFHLVYNTLKILREELKDAVEKKQMERMGILLNEKWLKEKSKEINSQSRQKNR